MKPQDSLLAALAIAATSQFSTELPWVQAALYHVSQVYAVTDNKQKQTECSFKTYAQIFKTKLVL